MELINTELGVGYTKIRADLSLPSRSLFWSSKWHVTNRGKRCDIPGVLVTQRKEGVTFDEWAKASRAEHYCLYPRAL